MGSDIMEYWAAYSPDVEAVLQNLRQEVFAKGRYFLASSPLIDDDGSTLDPDDPNLLPGRRAYLKRMKAIGGNPRTIEELMEWNGPEGAENILDISRISNNLYEAGATALLPLDTLIGLFGTDKPTREMIKSKFRELWEYTLRGTCIHIIVYENNEPREIVFIGSTFD